MTITGITSPNDSKADGEESRPRWKVRWADTERWEEGESAFQKKKKKKEGAGRKRKWIEGQPRGGGKEGRYLYSE